MTSCAIFKPEPEVIVKIKLLPHPELGKPAKPITPKFETITVTNSNWEQLLETYGENLVIIGFDSKNFTELLKTLDDLASYIKEQELMIDTHNKYYDRLLKTKGIEELK